MSSRERIIYEQHLDQEAHPIDWDEKLVQAVEPLLTSPSHGLNHSIRVLFVSRYLNRKYGGNDKITDATALVHDLGRRRTDLHQEDSIKESIRLAVPLLEANGYTEDEIRHIVTVVAEHDLPETETTTVESRNLKEADYIAGFGAIALERIISWSLESKGLIEEALKRMIEKMPKRIESLRHPESRRFAMKQLAFVKLFLAAREMQPDLEKESYPGRYIVFEGTSGSGKDTQAELLKQWLEKSGYRVQAFREPSEDTKEIRRTTREQIKTDPAIDLLLYSLDRAHQAEKLMESLQQGDIVIGNRSFISSVAYQGDTRFQQAFIEYISAQFVPYPDLIIHLDVKPTEALSRINHRSVKTRTRISRFEDLQHLTTHSNRFGRIADNNPYMITVDGNGSVESVFQSVVNTVERSNILPGANDSRSRE